MLVPAPGRAPRSWPRRTRAMPVATSCFASRRDAFFIAVETYNRTHRASPLPQPAVRLLAVMFAAEDVCCVSQQELLARGFGKSLPAALRALVEACFMSKQAG